MKLAQMKIVTIAPFFRHRYLTLALIAAQAARRLLYGYQTPDPHYPPIHHALNVSSALSWNRYS